MLFSATVISFSIIIYRLAVMVLILRLKRRILFKNLLLNSRTLLMVTLYCSSIVLNFMFKIVTIMIMIMVSMCCLTRGENNWHRFQIVLLILIRDLLRDIERLFALCLLCNLMMGRQCLRFMVSSGQRNIWLDSCTCSMIINYI